MLTTQTRPQTTIEYVTTKTGRIDWEATLSTAPLNGFALYDCAANPRLWNPDKGMLVFLPFNIPHPDFQFVAVDPFDEIEVVAGDIGTLLNHFAPVILGDAEEF